MAAPAAGSYTAPPPAPLQLIPKDIKVILKALKWLLINISKNILTWLNSSYSVVIYWLNTFYLPCLFLTFPSDHRFA